MPELECRRWYVEVPTLTVIPSPQHQLLEPPHRTRHVKQAPETYYMREAYAHGWRLPWLLHRRRRGAGLVARTASNVTARHPLDSTLRIAQRLRNRLRKALHH